MSWELSLKNFKIHKSLELNFPKSSLIRFFGNSGSGKSSVVSAISYALFGKVWKSKSLCRYGQKTLNVNLKFSLENQKEVYEIKRTNSPKHVTLKLPSGHIYEGDEADELICETLGFTFPQFCWGIFLKGSHGICEVGPQEKYEAVCALAGVSVDEVQEKLEEVQSMKKSIEKRMLSLEAKIGRERGILETIKNNLAQMNPIKLLEEPDSDIEDVLYEIQNVKLRLKETRDLLTNFSTNQRSETLKLISDLNAKKENFEEKLEETEGYDEAYIEKLTLANKIKKAKLNLQETLEFVKEENNKRKKQIYAFFGRHVPKGISPESYREYVSEIRDSHKAYNLEVNKRSKMIARKNTAREKISKIFYEARKTYKKILDDVNGPKAFISKLKELQIKNSPRRICPSCECSFVIIDQEVLSTEGLPDSDFETPFIEKIEGYINQINNELEDFYLDLPDEPVPPEGDLEKLENVLTKVEAMQVELRSLEAGKSPLITRVQQNLQTLNLEFEEKFPGSDEISGEISDEVLAEAKINFQERIRTIENMRSVQRKIKVLEKRLKTTDSIESLLEESSSLQTKLESLLKAKEYYEEYSRSQILNHRYVDLKTQAKKHTKTLENLEKAKNDSLRLISGFQNLKKKIKEAMLLSIEEAINSINSNASQYLNRLFDEGIEINLSISDDIEGKIITKVIHRGKEIKYEDLSDGERQRSRLAFFLGINDYLNPNLKLIIIDEALNQVEEALNLLSLDLLSEKPGTRIVISHEALEGKFDYQIEF
jgi:DNA repair exonuclease SbcCD ATPase subunit